MKVYIGTDHNGFYLRNMLVEYLKKAGYDVQDESLTQLNPEDDFPVFAQKVVKDVLTSDDPEPRGILLCGSGQGMCMTANRFKHIRAAMIYDRESARASRNDDDANIICLPAKTLEKDDAKVIVETFLNTSFAGADRYKRRIREMDEVGQG
ncbi:MAG TPA: RpiB/LacA/LacB family sugar-phosphate isomerase [Verrucomicrobiae bacterium]|nr:RpiB/LacA/LacB family sugar-phosphate isomerase [Verrucomicrobiae bacterium]